MQLEAFAHVGGLPQGTEEMVEHLVGLPAGRYDPKVAALLARAATWGYSEVNTFATKLAGHGLTGCDCAAITIRNDALLVDSAAIVTQSQDGRLVILSFRGTEPQNVINWLTNASAGMEPFLSVGNVHGGYHRSFRAVWPQIEILLTKAMAREPVCDAINEFAARLLGHPICATIDWKELSQPSLELAKVTALPPREHPMEGLYITGHSLGGALAILAAAQIHRDPQLDNLKGKLRGVYTFGAPMVGDEDFARAFEEPLKDLLFNHVYGHDIVPRLPPRTMGAFVPLGQEFRSTPGGWVHRGRWRNQVLTFVASSIVGVTAWALQQILPFRIDLPVSWADHAPLNYLRTSLMTPLGAELG
jgi:hypothetical protein